jgi:hypothetical protein
VAAATAAAARAPAADGAAPSELHLIKHGAIPLPHAHAYVRCAADSSAYSSPFRCCCSAAAALAHYLPVFLQTTLCNVCVQPPPWLWLH